MTWLKENKFKVVLLIFAIGFIGSGCNSDSGSSDFTNTSTKNNYINESTKYTQPAPSDSCCKHCTKGKACGDSCINVNYTCHKPPGCACDY